MSIFKPQVPYNKTNRPKRTNHNKKTYAKNEYDDIYRSVTLSGKPKVALLAMYEKIEVVELLIKDADTHDDTLSKVYLNIHDSQHEYLVVLVGINTHSLRAFLTKKLLNDYVYVVSLVGNKLYMDTLNIQNIIHNIIADARQKYDEKYSMTLLDIDYESDISTDREIWLDRYVRQYESMSEELSDQDHLFHEENSLYSSEEEETY
jgi:hypothetical protein